MAENKPREGFTFYRSFRDAINCLEDSGAKLEIYQAISDFALDNKEPDVETFSKMGKLCWIALRPNLNSDRQRYKNGCKGGAPVGNQNALKTTEKQPKNNLKTSNVNVNDNVDVNVNDKRERKSVARFTPPTLEEVKQYITENGYKLVDADSFYNHYEAIGWKVGKNPMKDWKACVRGWQSREKKQTPQQSVSTPKPTREWTC